MSVQVTSSSVRACRTTKRSPPASWSSARLEIARCDNDPNFAERGVFHLIAGRWQVSGPLFDSPPGDRMLAVVAPGSTRKRRRRVHNRPDWSAIGYRVGTHSRFKDSHACGALRCRLAGAARARAPARTDDFTIALLDGAAMVADVLTFYQERLAQ